MAPRRGRSNCRAAAERRSRCRSQMPRLRRRSADVQRRRHRQRCQGEGVFRGAASSFGCAPDGPCEWCRLHRRVRRSQLEQMPVLRWQRRHVCRRGRHPRRGRQPVERSPSTAGGRSGRVRHFGDWPPDRVARAPGQRVRRRSTVRRLGCWGSLVRRAVVASSGRPPTAVDGDRWASAPRDRFPPVEPEYRVAVR